MDIVFNELFDRAKKVLDDNTVLVVDGLNTFIRSFSIVDYVNVNGYYIGGLLGFLQSLAYAIRIIQPSGIIIVFDGRGGSQRRRKLYSEYKLNRTPSHVFTKYPFKDEDERRQSMKSQLRRLIQYFEYLPLRVIMVDNIEADDTISYLTTDVYKNRKICIMSTDTDFLQLVNDNVRVWSPTKKKIYDEKLIVDEYNVSSYNFIYYKALLGDVTDNIPGLNGFGKVTISKRLPILLENRMVAVDEIYEYATENASKYKVYRTLLDSKESFELNIRLMQLHHVDISGSAKMNILDDIDSKLPNINKMKILKCMMEDGLTAERIKDPLEWVNTHFLKLEKHGRVSK